MPRQLNWDTQNPFEVKTKTTLKGSLGCKLSGRKITRMEIINLINVSLYIVTLFEMCLFIGTIRHPTECVLMVI